MSTDAAIAWHTLDEPWREAFSQAWASWCGGSAAVGAAVVDPAGALVASGRNAMLEPNPSISPIAGTLMAHAEMTALAQLPTGDYSAHELYTTFEPCPMCACTIRIFHIARVHYASADPVWEGLHDVFTRVPAMARGLPERSLLGGPFGAFGHAIHVVAMHDRLPDWALDAHEQLAPHPFGLARRLRADGRLRSLADGHASVEEAVGVLWPELCEAATGKV